MRGPPAATARNTLGRAGLPLAGLAAVTAAIWALYPLDRPGTAQASHSTEAPIVHEPTQLVSLDSRPFSTPLWVQPAAPPAPPPPPPIPPPPSPLNVQLIAITAAPTGELSVILYDPDADRLLNLGEGGQIGDWRIVSISPREVGFTAAAGSVQQTLSLADPLSGSGGGQDGGGTRR